jgi:hypothetical protein
VNLFGGGGVELFFTVWRCGMDLRFEISDLKFEISDFRFENAARDDREPQSEIYEGADP